MRKAMIILAAFFCAACANYSANLPSIKPYKMDIQQGNVVTSKMMLQLRPGMTKAQVRFIMGTPLLVDSFHANRWDYLYRMEKGGKLIEQRHVILDFVDDKLKGVRGDVIPAGTGEPVLSTPAEAKKKEKGLVDKLKFWKSDEQEVPAKVESQPELISEPKPVQEKAAAPVVAPAPAPSPAPAAAPKAPVVEAPKPTPAEPPKTQEAAPAKTPETPTPKAATPGTTESTKAAEPVKAAPAKATPESAPADEDGLPPEDSPGYFERMLEKIGF